MYYNFKVKSKLSNIYAFHKEHKTFQFRLRVEIGEYLFKFGRLSKLFSTLWPSQKNILTLCTSVIISCSSFCGGIRIFSILKTVAKSLARIVPEPYLSTRQNAFLNLAICSFVNRSAMLMFLEFFKASKILVCQP